ncbi:hypothetical protein QEN19_000505 [Hanseniaspora menglaensis]
MKTLHQEDNKENEDPETYNRTKEVSKKLIVQSIYRNPIIKTDNTVSNHSARSISFLNTNSLLKSNGVLKSTPRQRSFNANMNISGNDNDDFDRFSAMKKRNSTVNFITNNKGKVLKQSMSSNIINRLIPFNKGTQFFLNNFNLEYSYAQGEKINEAKENLTSETESLLYDQSLDHASTIKANDSPEKQIQLINEQIFKEQVKRICQDSQNTDSPSAQSKNYRSTTSSPVKIISNLLEINSPIKSPLKSPMRSPVREQSFEEVQKDEEILKSYLKPQVKLKKISKIPQRILDAPNFNSDMTLTQISWNSHNILCVVLGNIVYLWNENNKETEVLHSNPKKKIISCISWCSDSIHLLVAYSDGKLELFDTVQKVKKREIKSVIGVKIISADWYNSILFIGNGNGTFTIHDVSKKDHLLVKMAVNCRDDDMFISKILFNHHLNKVVIGCSNGELRFYEFDIENPKSLSLCFSDLQRHNNSMIKAMQFNPSYPSLLATGSYNSFFGYMNFYDIKRNKFIKKIETGVEITSINWNIDLYKQSFELAITCGAPNNSVAIFDYNTGFKVAEIHKAHADKIVTGTMNNTNEVIATISAQENLSFFKIFDNEQLKCKTHLPIHKTENNTPLDCDNKAKSDPLQSPSKNLTIR